MKRVKVWVQRFADRAALQLQWIDPLTGRRRTISAKTSDPEQAEQARADKEYELANGLHQDTSRMTWEAFRELLEAEYLVNRRPNTQRAYRDSLNAFESICRPARLASITARTTSQFLAGMRCPPDQIRGGRACYAPQTIATYLECVRASLRWAENIGLIPKAPAFPQHRPLRRRPQSVPEDAVNRLLAELAEPFRTYALCGWLAGMRRNEAYYLRWEESDSAPWVDLDRERIIFPAAAVKGKEDQWVPLDRELRAALIALPRRGPEVFGFTLAPVSVGCTLIAASKRAGVKLTMRVLRRAFGCRYAGEVPAQVLQRLMRHSSITITMSYYANIDAAVEAAILGRNRSRNTGTKNKRAS